MTSLKTRLGIALLFFFITTSAVRAQILAVEAAGVEMHGVK
jgi:hypothetical protein